MPKSSSHSLLAAALFSMGTAGVVQASPVDRDVVRNEAGSVVVSTSGNCVRTRWVTNGDVCAPQQVVQKVERRQHRAIAQEERTVYFGFNQATLTSESQQKLDSLAKVLKSEQDVQGARIVGYADRIGSVSYNETLSKKRATVVKDRLVARGIVNTRVAETRWLGETAPVTNCPDTLKRPELIECLQKDRRVEVEIDYLPETPEQR